MLTVPAHKPIKPWYIEARAIDRPGEGNTIVRPEHYEIAIRLLTDAEGGGFGATVPELPGCMSDGETPREALQNVYDAIACWMEAAEEMGPPVPEPQPQPHRPAARA
jgi:antitoxin HicB